MNRTSLRDPDICLTCFQSAQEVERAKLERKDWRSSVLARDRRRCAYFGGEGVKDDLQWVWLALDTISCDCKASAVSQAVVGIRDGAKIAWYEGNGGEIAELVEESAYKT